MVKTQIHSKLQIMAGTTLTAGYHLRSSFSACNAAKKHTQLAKISYVATADQRKVAAMVISPDLIY